MRSVYYRVLSPSKVAVLDLSPSLACECCLMICRVNVPPQFRGRGIASELLREVIEEADEEGWNLELLIWTSGGLTNGQLTAWYERNDFYCFDRMGRRYIRPARRANESSDSG